VNESWSVKIDHILFQPSSIFKQNDPISGATTPSPILALNYRFYRRNTITSTWILQRGVVPRVSVDMCKYVFAACVVSCSAGLAECRRSVARERCSAVGKTTRSGVLTDKRGSTGCLTRLQRLNEWISINGILRRRCQSTHSLVASSTNFKTLEVGSAVTCSKRRDTGDRGILWCCLKVVPDPRS